MTQANLPLVLAVDDERHNLTLLERMLRGDYRVISVTNAQAALDTLLQAPFDIILLDIMMPEMDGMNTLKAIRSDPRTSDIPIILISAMTDGQSVAQGLEAEPNDYIAKPIDFDITRARIRTQLALQKLQKERNQTIEKLQTAQEMKDRLLRMASHDLKGPLMNIRMASTLMESAAECIPDGTSLISAIESSLDTMQNVIKDFLDTAALQTGALDLHLEAIAVEGIIDDVLAENRVNALRKHITLEMEDSRGVICADPARFRQALGNLVNNAIKYSPAEASVTVWTECDDSTVTIYVADAGPGIPPSEQDKLFTQFGKLSPRPTGGESSTGLGLWIVKHLITLQSGRVGYLAPRDGGSIFWIQMPITEA